MSVTPPRKKFLDSAYWLVTRGAGAGVIALIVALVLVLVVQSLPVLLRAGEYQLFTSAKWVPKPADGGMPIYGSLAFIYGTVITSAFGMLLAVPVGVAAAAYLSEVAPYRVRKAGAFLIELLAAIPSIVYGFWGLFFLAPAVQRVFDRVGGPNTGGMGLLSAGLILAIMVLPYITAISYDVCRSVPRSQREGALALGATRWQTIREVVIPYGRPGIVAACFLALGRALGETMAVTMLIGNREDVRLSPFALGDSIASRVANQLNEADAPSFHAALVALALILLLVTAAFNALARLMLTRLNRKPRRTHVDLSPPVDVASGTTTPLPPRVPLPSGAAANCWNRIMLGVLCGAFVLAVTPLFLIVGDIACRGISAVDAALFLERARPPFNAADPLAKPGGLGHAMLGSLCIVAAATALAVPLSLAAAVFLAEARRSRTAKVVRFLAELLGGVPSVVIGIFAYVLFVAPSYSFVTGSTAPLGFSGWAGAVALAVMMIPIVVRSAEEALKLVPESLREASYALGASRMQTSLTVILPAAMPAVVTGIFLAIGRIAGETAPLLLTAGNSDFWPTSMSEQTPYLPGSIYTYSRSQYDDWQRQAWAAALILLLVVMVLNGGIRMLAGTRVVAASRAD